MHTDCWIPARASFGRNDEDDFKLSHVALQWVTSKVDGPSPLPVSSLVRNHSQDFIREGGLNNG